MTTGKHFEEFQVGQEYISPWKTITETHFINFLNNNGFVEPMFDDPVFREEIAGHSRQMVPGFLTVSTSYGFFTQSNWLTGTGLALVECSISFEEPVFVDDDIRCRISVSDKTPTSSDRGGIVSLDWEIESRDEDVEVVATIESSHFVRKE